MKKDVLIRIRLLLYQVEAAYITCGLLALQAFEEVAVNAQHL